MHCLNFPASGNITALEWKGEEWQKLLFNSMQQGVCAIDTTYRFTACNIAAARMFGHLSQNDLIGKDARSLLPENDDLTTGFPSSLASFLKRQNNENGLHSIKERFKRHDGSMFPVEYWARRMRFHGEHAGFIITFSDITQRQITLTLLQSERFILEQITSDTPLNELLDQINQEIENMIPGYLSSILILDSSGESLISASSPSLPDGYINGLQAVRVGPDSEPCGVAAYLKKQLVVPDIQESSLWSDYRDLAQQYGLVSCWSTPILSAHYAVLGAFAVYSRINAQPGKIEQDVIERMTHLAGIAIERDQTAQALQQSGQRYRSLLSATTAVVWTANANGSFATPQKSWERFTAQPWAQHRGWGWIKMLHPQDRPQAEARWKQALSRRRHFQFECRVWHALSNGYHYVSVRAEPMLDENDLVLEWAGLIIDVHEKKTAELALKESQIQHKFLYDNNPSMFFMLDVDGIILSANQYGAQQLGYAQDELTGQPQDVLFCEDDKNKAETSIDFCFHTQETVHQWVIQMICKDGARLWVRINARSVCDISGSLVALLVCENITQARQLSDELAYQASHDELTGLYNRRKLESYVKGLISSSRLSDMCHAFCYIDLDQFKIINDTCGHVAGDSLLKQVGELLSSQVRPQDIVARLGGDEFGVLFQASSLESARTQAEKLRRAIAKYRFGWNEKVFSIGASIGIAPLNADSGGFAEVMSAADRACYAAKDKGRNRIHLFIKGDATLSRQYGEMEWASRLQRALDQNEFVLEYQSIVAANNDDQTNDRQRGRHYELLLRLQDGEGKLILPNEFIPAAERFSLIQRVDQWVIYRCFEWLAQNSRISDETFLCSINISGYSIDNPAFLNYIISKFERYKIPTEKICFEITETAAVSNLVKAAQFIARLSAIGCKFSLDDFGSGVSSFAYLKNLPVNYLKIDGVFVKGIISDMTDYAIVKSFNEIGHSMGMLTVVEFIENEPTLNAVKEIGADYLQGYHIAPPRPLYQMQ